MEVAGYNNRFNKMLLKTIKNVKSRLYRITALWKNRLQQMPNIAYNKQINIFLYEFA